MVMKKNLKNSLIVIAACLTVLVSCKRDSDYIKSTPSAYISNLDLRKLYRGTDVTLTRELTREATIVCGQVTSNHSGNNLPAGLLFIQNKRASGNGIDSLRGMAINIGSAAANYVPGDSVHIKIEGGTLTRVKGILQITGIPASNVQKIATGINVLITKVSSVNLYAKPDNYEGCLTIYSNINFEPNIGIEKIEGVKIFNDGLGNVEMNVNSTANFKDQFLPYDADVTGLILPSATTGKMQVWPRVKADFVSKTLVVDPNVALGPTPVIITGYLADPSGTDTNYEYVQLMATQDLDFRQKNFTVIITNNAGASTPTGFPANGWATGGLRTYKFNLTKGTVAKGQFFYVGGDKVINGAGSTNISQANWIVSRLYGSVKGDDGVGDVTTNLLANSGNAAGIAVFAPLPNQKVPNVGLLTVPCDVIFYAGNGDVFGVLNGVTVGYTIANNDLYNTANGTFFNQGTNKGKFVAPDANAFSYLGGVFDVTANTWKVPRTHKSVKLTGASPLSLIEVKDDFTKAINFK